MKTFFIGCTHFGHANIIKLANRPFTSVDEMDEHMIERWNEVVGENDHVYHLGDFMSWKKDAAPAEHYIGRLNGKITFIRGNHDPFGWGHHYLRVETGWKPTVLFHYPIEEWDGWYRGSIHMHCHTHQPMLVTAKNRFNVTVEATNYRPISLEEIQEIWANQGEY